MLSCDTQQMFYETCRGWDDFNNAQLTQFCSALLGDEAIVTGKRTLPVIWYIASLPGGGSHEVMRYPTSCSSIPCRVRPRVPCQGSGTRIMMAMIRR